MLVSVAIPSHDGKVCAQTVDSLLAEQVLGADQGVHILVQWQIGTALIGVARNKLAKAFLDIPKAECMVMVDADISWKAGELIRLARQPHDVIGGTYRQKSDDVRFHVFGKPKPDGDLYQVDGLPGGFLKINRGVFDQIEANCYADNAGNVWRDYFPTGFHEGRFYGEDYGFCRLWREAGGEVYLDPSIKLRHHDGFRAYQGDVSEWLKGQVNDAG